MKENIKKLESITSESDIVKEFPNAKRLNLKSSHVFYEIDLLNYVKFYFRHKDGTTMDSHTSYVLDDVDYNKIDVCYYYMGPEGGPYVDVKRWNLK